MEFKGKLDYANILHARNDLETRKSEIRSNMHEYAGKQIEIQKCVYENLEMKRKIAMMPQIRIKNVSEELELAKKLFIKKTTDHSSPNRKLSNRLRVQTSSLNANPIDQSFSPLAKMKLKSQATKQEDIEQEARKQRTKERLLKFDTLGQMNESLFESKLKYFNPRTQSNPTSPYARLHTPSSQIQYSDLQLYFKRLQRDNDLNNKTMIMQKQKLQQISIHSHLRPGSSVATQHILAKPQTRQSSIHDESNILGLKQQNIKFTSQVSKIPHTREAFLKFYLLKKQSSNTLDHAYMQLQKEPTSSQEVMECREGMSVVKTMHDHSIYIFGGRNIMPLNKLETFDPTLKHFKVQGYDNCSYVQGRFDQSMVAYKNELIIYGGQTGSSQIISKSMYLKDIVSFNISSGQWKLRKQNKLQNYSRRNHLALCLNRFMIIYGGLNDFNKNLDDTIIYDIECDTWVTDFPVEGYKMPGLSHSKGYAAFYAQRHSEQMRNIGDLKDPDWGKSSQLIKEEGFYLFGGLLEEGEASNDVCILKIEQYNLKWSRATKRISGAPPLPRYSHAMTYFEKENALIVQGGRNDKLSQVFSDVYLLTLDTLTWIQVILNGDGCIGRADHHIITDTDYDFVIMGGIDGNYHLSNKMSYLTFDQDKIQALTRLSQVRNRNGSLASSKMHHYDQYSY